MKRVTNKGFTLIELLVVIAIIAILAAILFPIFTNAKERGRQAQCLSNLKQLSSTMRLYADDFNGGLPASCPEYCRNGERDWCGCPAVGNPNFDVATGAIWRYTGKNRNLYRCPTDKGMKTPGVANVVSFPISFSMNDKLSYRKPDNISARQSRMLLFIHEAKKTLNDGNFNWWVEPMVDVPSDVHWQGTTLVYLDGHAVWANKVTLIADRNAGRWDPDVSK